MLNQFYALQNRLIATVSTDRLVPGMYRFGPWAETAAITLLACLLGWLISPEDPLFLHGGFPWLWLAPLLIALRYGLLPGITSVLGLLVNWLLFAELSGQATELPRIHFTGGALLTLICGEYNMVWHSRSAQQHEANGYLKERLTRLTRRYLLLRLSHDRIEQELLGRPGSLRDALAQLREITPGSSSDTPLPNIDELLQLMAQYCQLEAAAVYALPVCKGKHCSLQPPLTITGEPLPLQTDDPMLKRVMEQRTLVHVAEQGNAQHLLIAPILTSGEKMLGVLVVSHMPFFALNHENLQLIELLLGYYADVVHVGNEVQDMREKLPSCPWAFIEELVRVQHVQQRIGLDSHLVIFHIDGDKAYEIAGEMERMHRSLDVVWPIEQGEQAMLVVLLPLATKAASEEYVQRIRYWVNERYGIENTSPRIDVVNIPLSHGDAIARLQSVLSTEMATP